MNLIDAIATVFKATPAAPPSATAAAPRGSLAAAIHAAAPSADVATWAAAMAAPLAEAGITTPARMAAFVAQVAVESGGLTELSENLTYTTASRLCAVWPSRFPTEAAAAPYVRAPEALANHVYACRLGNGNEASGDGWRFRGAGLIQLTGRANHAAFGATVGKAAEATADWCRTPAGAAASAAWFWHTHGLNTLADAWDVDEISRRLTAARADVSRITETVNGGQTGAAERLALSQASLAALLT